jgi:hypothetical protein
MRVNRLKIQPRYTNHIGLVFKDDNYPHEEDNAYSGNVDEFSIPYLRKQFHWLIKYKGFKTIGYYANW